MTSQYPNAIDNIPPAPDGYISVNAAISAINNIENELGILPSGPYPTVRVRLDVLESRINNPNSSSGSGEFITIGGTGVFVIAGDGDPNTTYPIANPGSLFLREDGYNIQGLYSMRTDGTWHQIDTDPWTAAGDLSGSIYSQEVIGIDGYLLPNISIGNLNWTGSAWAFTPAPTSLPPSGPAGAGGEGDLTGSYPNPTLANVIGPTTTTGSSTTVPVITVNRKGQVIGLTSANIAFPTTLPPDGYAGGDLTGSYPNPTVAQISGASGNFNWLASTTNPSIIHLPQTTDTGATNLTINAQSAWTGSVANVLGGSLYLKAGNASDTAPGASISLSGASPRSVANASDIQFAADQYQFSSATNAAANTFILDPINAVFYANGISPLATLGKPGKYWNTTYTNSLYTNQITNTTAPTAGQFMLENATANGIAWTSLSGDVSASTSTIGKLTVNGIAGNTIPTPDGYSTSLVWNGRSFNWVSEGGSPLGIGLPATSNPNWNQSWLVSQWYIDPINGNDVYLGTSPDNALQTFQGLIAILGTISPVWTTPVTISYMNSVVSNDVIILTPILQEGASITFNCYNTSGPAIDPAYPSISGFIEPTVQHVVNVVSVVPKSRTVNGNQWQIVADTDLTGLVGITSNGSSSSAVGSMIHDLTNNSWFWLDSVVSGTGSSALLQLSQPMKKTSFAQIAANVSGAYAPDEVDTISAGDHLVVYTWPSVYLQSVSGTNSVPFGYTIGFQNLTLPATDDYINSGITFVECNLSSFYIYSTGYISLVNCTTSIAIGQGVQVNGGVIGTAECTSGGFGEITADALMSKYPYYTASDGYTFDGYSVSYIGGAGIFITSACANAEIGCGSQYEYPVSQSGFTINNKNYYSATYDGYGIIYGTGSIHLYNGAAVGVHAYGANITATNSIRLPSIVVDDYGSSIDRSVTPSQQYPYPSRAITPALIDASISSGGFGGFVYGNCGSTIAMFTPGNTPIVAVTPYLGTAGLDGYAVPTPSTNNTVLTYNSGALSWSPTSSGFTAAGDLSGNSSSQEVIGIDGYLLPPLSNGFLQWNGSAWAYSTPGSGFSAGGDLNGSSTSQTVVAIQGNPVSSTAPTAGQILVENAAATGSSWSSLSGDGYLSTSTPGHLTITGASGNFTVSGNLTVSGAETIVGSSTFQSNAVVDGYLKVATMSSGIVRSDGYGNLTSSNGTAGQFLVENAAATSSTWATISGDLTASPSVPGQLSLISRGLPGTYGNSTTFIGLTTDAQGRVTNVTTYSIPTSLTVGGDLYNTTANATVQKIQGQSFQSGTPTVGQFVVATYPSGTGYGHISITGDISSSATTAGKLTVTGIQGLSVTSAAPSSNQYLSYNGMSIVWSSLPTSFTVGGDLSGTTASATVAKLDGYTLPNPGAASSNTVLTWNGTALSWTSAGSSPTGTAGGDLAGTYPNPTLAVIGTGGTYGDPTHYATVTIDSKGRVTGASSQPLPSGGGAGKIVNVTAATTLSAPTTLITHVFLKAVASGGYTIVLPGVAASAGFIIQVKDCGGNVSSSNVVYIQAAEVGTTIDGITAGLGQTLYPFQATFGSMRFASDGVSWYIE